MQLLLGGNVDCVCFGSGVAAMRKTGTGSVHNFAIGKKGACPWPRPRPHPTDHQ